MASYQTINDQRYSFVSEVALRNEILLAGRKRVIFDDTWNAPYTSQKMGDYFFIVNS